jgi:hypothetical protein
MSRLKKTPHQRQTSDSLRARAVTITPIHRESIVKPKHTSIVPRASGTMADITGASTSAMTPDQTTSKKQNRVPNDSVWMTKWFAEPPGDVATCCMGIWFPCVLYGKTDWRLRQVAMGEDALDDKWECKYGCNAPCWAFWMVSYLTANILPGKPI